ncbi:MULTISPECIES: SHOCT domain-containing protein [unclassified Kitasatospora]|uniref:SHOCT domain-containing protein n=1 Tax=unclassified Kitasatospora TaxID=2633591 RepID=UPI0033D76B51
MYTIPYTAPYTPTSLAADYPVLNIFWTTCLVFLWILWFMLLFRVFGDLFRDDSLSGWAKAGWTVFVLVLPFLGVFIYLIARGKGMGLRELKAAQEREAEFRSYVREAAGSPPAPSTSTPTDELARLAELHNTGKLTDEEYQRAKDRILG